jgi:hypothetical protein
LCGELQVDPYFRCSSFEEPGKVVYVLNEISRTIKEVPVM